MLPRLCLTFPVSFDPWRRSLCRFRFQSAVAWGARPGAVWRGIRMQRRASITFNAKILENSPASGQSGALLRTPLYTAYTFLEKYTLHKVILWIWLSWLCLTNFCFPSRKVVHFLLSQLKNRSRTYGYDHVFTAIHNVSMSALKL